MKTATYLIMIIALLQSGCSNYLHSSISFSEIEVPVMLGNVRMIGGNSNQDGNRLCHFDVASTSRGTYFDGHYSRSNPKQEDELLYAAVRDKDRWISIDEIYIGNHAFFFIALIRGSILTNGIVVGAQGNVYSSTTGSSVECGKKQTGAENQWL